MKILPDSKPQFKQSSFEKVCRYFLGNNWKELYPVVELAIRNPKIAFYNDELAVWTNNLGGIKTFNWNADPSAYIIKGQPKAILKKGVHFYKLSYHHIWNGKKRYVALRPTTADEQLPVWRRDSNGKLSSSVAVAINQHKGGSDSTWSEGCQTTHFSQYPDFIQTIGNAFDIKVPLGIVAKPDSRLTRGVGKFPYILIDQKDFNYILSLDENEFDSAADMKYQAANFVGVPKIERVKPVEEEIENANAILSAVEIEEAENISLKVSQSPAAAPAEISASQPTEDSAFQASETSETPAAVEKDKFGGSAKNQPPPETSAPLGDEPNAAPRKWLNVEDWKPFVIRMLWRVWAGFVGLVTAVFATFQGLNFSDWRVWVALFAVIFVFLFVVALIISAVLLLIWYFNRKEIVHFKTEEIKTALDPHLFNFGLNFEKK